MPSLILQTADAVTAVLAEPGLLPAGVVPVRGYSDWALELQDANVLHVDVVPDTTAIKTKLSTRGKRQYTVPCDIVIRQRFGQDKQDDETGRICRDKLDALVELGEAIDERFIEQRLAEFPAGAWQETKILFLPHALLLYEQRQFTGVIRVTFRVEKAVQA